MLKILAVGNSFSQDATRHLETISESAGIQMFVRNCYIGGCSLERHASNLHSDLPEYEYQKNGEILEKISLSDAVRRESWDYITVQQVSGLSGIPDSYQPYLDEIISFLHAGAPQSRIVFHRTWQYEKGSEHPDFPKYDCSPEKMFSSLKNASEIAAEKYSLGIIPVGNAVNAACKLKEFDRFSGGDSLYRDGYHLSEDFGRYLAGLVWFRYFTGKSSFDAKFRTEKCTPHSEFLLKKVCDEFCTVFASDI